MLMQGLGTDLMDATRKRRERQSSTRRRLGAAVAYGTFRLHLRARMWT